MSKRFYRAPYTGTLTNAGGDADLMALTPADDKPIELVGFSIGQSSENSDAAEENVRLTIYHMTATVTVTGGTAVTPVPNRPGTDLAAGFTATANSSTVATTSGTATVVEELAFNIRANPYVHWIPEEMRPRAFQGEYLLLRLQNTLADDVTGEVTLYVAELG